MYVVKYGLLLLLVEIKKVKKLVKVVVAK